MEINWLAVIAAAASSFVLGGVWYGALFGDAWLKAAGLTKEQAMASNKALIFGGSFVLSLIASATFAMFLGPNVDAMSGALYGLCADFAGSRHPMASRISSRCGRFRFG